MKISFLNQAVAFYVRLPRCQAYDLLRLRRPAVLIRHFIIMLKLNIKWANSRSLLFCLRQSMLLVRIDNSRILTLEVLISPPSLIDCFLLLMVSATFIIVILLFIWGVLDMVWPVALAILAMEVLQGSEFGVAQVWMSYRRTIGWCVLIRSVIEELVVVIAFVEVFVIHSAVNIWLNLMVIIVHP